MHALLHSHSSKVLALSIDCYSGPVPALPFLLQDCCDQFITKKKKKKKFNNTWCHGKQIC